MDNSQKGIKNYRNDSLWLASSTAKLGLQLQLGPVQPDIFPVNLEEFALIKNPYDLDSHSFIQNKKDLIIISAKQTHDQFKDNQILHTMQIELQQQFLSSNENKNHNYQTIDISPSKISQAQFLQQQSSENSFHKLEFLDEFQGNEQESSDQEQKVYPKTYYDGYGFLSRIFFIHIYHYMVVVKAKIIDKGLKIRVEHLPSLSDLDRIEPIFAQALRSFQQTCQNKKSFTKWDMVKLIYLGVLRIKTFKILFCYLIDFSGQNILSILMGFLIQSIYSNDKQWAYIYGVILSLVSIASIMGKHNAYYYQFQFSIQARMILINMVYQKLTELNSYSIKEANVGKIINLVSGDLNTLEFYLVMSFQLMIMPFSLAFGCGILWVRFNGPIGLVAVAIMVTVYPMQIMYQKIASSYTIEAKKYGDNRLKLQNELIEGIRLIKMYAWEQAFDQLIKTVRQKEFTCFTKIFLIDTLDRGVNQMCHMWASLLFFVIIYYGNYVTLTSANMIPTIQLVVYLKTTCIFLVSQSLQSWINIGISFQRMVDILTLENFEMKQLEPYEVQKANDFFDSSFATPVLSFKNFSCYWTANVAKQTQPVLKDINLDIYPGDLVAIVGRIGSGKSTLLNSIIMEVPSYLGQYNILGKSGVNQLSKIQVGYVEQEPFIFPDTIRKNILFGRPYNSQLYNLVVQVSSMIEDLNLMQNGDMTEIGERGINLSGGQKARVSLARALYQMADVYIFDDPLSAVDAKVARSIFDSAIKDFIFKVQPKLSGSFTKPVVLLATHQIQFAIECDYMVVLDGGSMVAKGQYNQIKNNLNMISKDFAVLENKNILQKTYKTLLKNEKSTVVDRSPSNKIIDKEKIALYKREENSQQDVTLHTYMRYFSKWTPFFLIFTVIIQSLGYEIVYNFYLRYISLFDQYDRNEMLSAFVIMGILCVIGYVNNMMKYVANTSGVLQANRSLHHDMLEQLCLSPVAFFDTNPSGRILNRFSTDLSLADTQVCKLLWDIEEYLSFFFVALITLLILQPWFIFAMILTIVANIFILKFSQTIIVQTKECDLIQRSPLFDLFKKTLSGVIQVRLYKQQIWFQKNFFELSNKCIQSNLAFFYTQRSFGFNIAMLGQLASTFGIFLIIKLNHSNTAVFVQALLLLLTFNDSQQWCLRQLITFDASMNCFNRMFQIIDLVPEAPHHLEIDHQMKNAWPSQGEITFTNVFLRYREDTDLVLKGMSFSIKSCDKVGCVGRTGAGKSSILQALFRMVEIQPNVGGSILIDGLDISKLGLAFLRSSIAIIPQTPFVFSGTIKRNLDPLEQYSDEALWQVLQETNLISIVKKMTHQLDTDMTDVNSIFSVGEKQLICLARTILSNRKIIVLDEATANVDMKTDEFIQKKIREKFSDCTIITIAHRLNTIADYDKVMVIESGIVAEYGPPLELLSSNLINPVINRDTLFAALVIQTGPENSAIILELARNHYQKSVKIV